MDGMSVLIRHEKWITVDFDEREEYGKYKIRLLHSIEFISLKWNLQNLVNLYDPLQYEKDER